MKVGIPAEIFLEEHRVAATPVTVKRLIKQGFTVSIETQAGLNANISDIDYINAGALIIESSNDIYSQSDIVLKVKEPTLEEVGKMRKNLILFCYLWPSQNNDLLQKLANQGVNAIAMDAIPRITKAQKMDVLSSMANISGYRAVIEGSYHFGRFLNGQITAAGKVEPAKVLVIGAGVAGLAAIGAANSLGAIVRAFDTRKEVSEQIESMGATFLTVALEEDGATSSGYSKEMSKEFIEAEMQLFLTQAKEVDIIITTAQIPGKLAPKLLLDYHVNSMKPGSVIVDLAAATGGNCALTKNQEVYTTSNGVTIVGKLSQLPSLASQLYGNNLCNLLEYMGNAENWQIDHEDTIISRSMVTFSGEINWPPAPLPVSLSANGNGNKTDVIADKELNSGKVKESKKIFSNQMILLGLLGTLLLVVGKYAPAEFMQHFTVFVLSVFVGWQLITNVAHSLHTPLMAVTNAISGIIVVGGLLQVTNDLSNPVTLIAIVAIIVASINIVGGFLVTHRMLNMFKK
jgi:NAD(P) transhydrogenase subunit alpha